MEQQQVQSFNEDSHEHITLDLKTSSLVSLDGTTNEEEEEASTMANSTGAPNSIPSKTDEGLGGAVKTPGVQLKSNIEADDDTSEVSLKFSEEKKGQVLEEIATSTEDPTPKEAVTQPAITKELTDI